MVPTNPKIYHITHLENLAQMFGVGLLSDAERIRQGLQCTIVGMKEIAVVKEHKQAEFLVERFFPWNLVERIGVIDETKTATVAGLLGGAEQRPEIVVQKNWYY